MISKLPNQKHEKFFQALCATMKTHGADLSAEEMLAIACNLVGKLIAMQDQCRYSPETIMRMVSRNIEAGNAEVLKNLSQTEGSA